MSLTLSSQRIYLNVPYAQKNFAKQFGARWDANKRQWYCIGETIPDQLQQFSVQPHTSTRRFLRCRSCGQSGHTGGYPFSTLPSSGRCDDCV